MNPHKKNTLNKVRTFDELLDHKYGAIGSPKRDQFEEKAQYFIISEVLKASRKQARMTQEELARKVGTKRTCISRLKNSHCNKGNVHHCMYWWIYYE